MEILFYWLTMLGVPMVYAGIFLWGLEFAGTRAGLRDDQRESLASYYVLLVGFSALLAGVGVAGAHDPRIEVLIPAVNGRIARDLDIPWTLSLGFAQLGWALLGGGIATAFWVVAGALNIWIARWSNGPVRSSEWRE